MKKIAIVLGVVFLLGAVAAPVMAQTMPQLPAAQGGQEIQLPDYSGWEVAQAVGSDINLDGETDFYQKTLVNKVRLGPEEEALGKIEQLQLIGKFGEEPELVIWMATEITFEGPIAKFRKFIVRKDGKYWEVSPFLFQTIVQKFFESFPKVK